MMRQRDERVDRSGEVVESRRSCPPRPDEVRSVQVIDSKGWYGGLENEGAMVTSGERFIENTGSAVSTILLYQSCPQTPIRPFLWVRVPLRWGLGASQLQVPPTGPPQQKIISYRIMRSKLRSN
jgi:hypothetical protein